MWEYVGIHQGRDVSSLSPLVFEDYLQQYTMFSLWRRALENRSGDAYHTLALHTDDEELEDIMSLATSHHDFRAVHCLLARLWKFKKCRLMPFIACTLQQCPDCAMIRRRLLSLYPHVFDKDFTFVRGEFAKARASNSVAMMIPILSLRPDTDVIVYSMQHTSKTLWRTLQFATMARILWKRWIEKQLHPDSNYIKLRSRQFHVS